MTDQIGYNQWWKLDKTTMWQIKQMRFTPKMKLSYVTDQIGSDLWWKQDKTMMWPIA